MADPWATHEVANNEWMRGAEDHQPDVEGGYAARMAAAVRAYHEWLPTREPPGVDVDVNDGETKKNMAAAYNRTVHFGDVASITVLETRLTAGEREKRGGGVNYLYELITHVAL